MSKCKCPSSLHNHVAKECPNDESPGGTRGLKKNTGVRNAGIKLRKSAWPDTVTNPWRFVRRLSLTGPITTDAIVSVVRTGI